MSRDNSSSIKTALYQLISGESYFKAGRPDSRGGGRWGQLRAVGRAVEGQLIVVSENYFENLINKFVLNQV